MKRTALGLLATLGLSALLTAPAVAQSTKTDRACVQDNLTILGYDTRGVDGSFGRNSYNAASAFLEDNEVLLPELSKDNAGQWCEATASLVAETVPDMSANCDNFNFIKATEKPLVGNWTGKFVEGFYAHLMVKNVTSRGTAQGFYSPAPADKPGESIGCFPFTNASVDGDTITIIEWADWGFTEMTFTLGEDGLMAATSLEAGVTHVGHFFDANSRGYAGLVLPDQENETETATITDGDG